MADPIPLKQPLPSVEDLQKALEAMELGNNIEMPSPQLLASIIKRLLEMNLSLMRAVLRHKKEHDELDRRVRILERGAAANN